MFFLGHKEIWGHTDTSGIYRNSIENTQLHIVLMEYPKFM